MRYLSLKLASIIAASLLLVGCFENKEVEPDVQQKIVATIDADDIGIRKTSLDDEAVTVGDKTNYSDSYAGSGHKIKRAFQDAPPMIPHDTEGMLPITIHDNQCISCHMPEVAPDVGATSIPESHFYDMRPRHQLLAGDKFVKATDNMKNETSVKNLNGELSGSRFNCSACHAPQSTGQLVENTFEAEFTDADGENLSGWKGTRLYEGLDTEVLAK